MNLGQVAFQLANENGLKNRSFFLSFSCYNFWYRIYFSGTEEKRIRSEKSIYKFGFSVIFSRIGCSIHINFDRIFFFTQHDLNMKIWRIHPFTRIIRRHLQNSCMNWILSTLFGSIDVKRSDTKIDQITLNFFKKPLFCCRYRE